MNSHSKRPQPRHRGDFDLAILCVLKVEFDAIEACFDRHWDKDYGKEVGASLTQYSNGRIGEHDVVLAFMPGMGKVNAANVAHGLRASYYNIRFALVVGVCGGAPTNRNEEIILGDVIISTQVVQSDFGRQLPSGLCIKDTIQDSLSRPNTEIRSYLAKLSSRRTQKRLRDGTSQYLSEILQKEGFESLQYPGATEDHLYQPSYRHKHHLAALCQICANCQNETDAVCGYALAASCADLGCDKAMLVNRRRLTDTAASSTSQGRGHQPHIHMGLVSSSDHVLKSASHRDELASQRGIIGYEMESAGVWDTLPTIVVKGVCDYADTHKNKRWQGYAAASAAACLKAMLKIMTVTDRSPTAPPVQAAETSQYNLGLNLSSAPLVDESSFIGRDDDLMFLEQVFVQNPDSSGQKIAIVSGLGGMGKTQLALAFARKYQREFTTILWLSANSETKVRQHIVSFTTEVLGASCPQDDTKNANKLDPIQNFRSWLSQPDNKQWLLIFDNHDEPLVSSNPTKEAYDIKQYFPHRSQGSILITTRSTRLSIGKVLKLKKLPSEAARNIILQRSGREEPDEGDLSLEQLADRLDGLPLALVTAGDNLRYMPETFAEYLKLYERCWNDLSNVAEELPEYEGGRTLYTTWNITLRMIPTEAVELLQFLAYFDNQDIWFDLLRFARGDGTRTGLSSALSNTITFSNTMRKLQSLSLVETTNGGYSLHTCVHDWTYHHLNREVNEELYILAFRCVAHSFREELDSIMLDVWYRLRRYLAHAIRLRKLDEQNVTIPWDTMMADCDHLETVRRSDLERACRDFYLRQKEKGELESGQDSRLSKLVRIFPGESVVDVLGNILETLLSYEYLLAIDSFERLRLQPLFNLLRDAGSPDPLKETLDFLHRRRQPVIGSNESEPLDHIAEDTTNCAAADAANDAAVDAAANSDRNQPAPNDR